MNANTMMCMMMHMIPHTQSIMTTNECNLFHFWIQNQKDVKKLVQFMREKCVHELTVVFMSDDPEEDELCLDLDLDLDLDGELDDYVLHPQPQRSLRIIHAFMSATRTIDHVREETVTVENGVLRQEQLIWCIKQQQQQQRAQCKTHFKLRTMFLYNMDLEAEEMRDFLQTKQPSHQFLTPISAVEDVVIQPTIPMFARLNALHIMYEASNYLGNHSPNNPHNPHNQSKKRVVIHPHPHHHLKKRKFTRRT